MTLNLDAAIVQAIRAHAEEGFPEEVCGAVLAGPAGQEIRRMANIQNRLHAEDPVANPRDARTAYQMEPRELFEVNRDGDRPGWSIALFYHSHPSHGAYFSDTDRARALWGEPGDGAEPAYPGVAYMVVSVYDRAVRDLQVYAWDEATRDFAAIPFGAA